MKNEFGKGKVLYESPGFKAAEAKHKALDKAKHVPKKLHVTHDVDKGWYKGNSNERIVPINGRYQIKSQK